MIKHLSDYGLEHVFDLTKYFQSFSGRAHMLLNGNTLSSLEIYRNQTDFTTKGSLFWTLDRTKTKFGRRLLRHWVGRPLLDKHQLELRVAAVEESRREDNPKIEKLKTLLAKTSYDLEKGLIRIYYGKCTRPELLTVLQTLLRIAGEFRAVENPEDMGFDSSIINKAIASLPEIKDDLIRFLGVFNHQAAVKDDKYDFFRDENDDEYEAILNYKLGISAVESDLEEHKKEIAKVLKVKSVKYVTVSGIEYMVEVPTDKASQRNVPATWAKVQGSATLFSLDTSVLTLVGRKRSAGIIRQRLSSCSASATSTKSPWRQSATRRTSASWPRFRASTRSSETACTRSPFRTASYRSRPSPTRPAT